MQENRFLTLRDWKRHMKDKGRGHLVKAHSPNPYIRRIVKDAERYGWSYPFKVSVGKAGKEERKKLLKDYWNKMDERKRSQEVEKKLIDLIFRTNS